MSVLFTESFMAFEKTSLADNNAAMSTLRTNTLRSLIAAGYAGNFTVVSNGGFVVRPDPVIPERQALVHSAAAFNNGTSSFRFNLAGSGDTVIGGFSLFVPLAWQPSPAYQYVMSVSFIVSAANAAYQGTQDTNAPVPGEMMRIRFDGGIAYGGEVQSSKKITPGKQMYFEYSLSPTELRVWCDDTLVLQKTVALTREVLTINVHEWGDYGASSGMYGAAGAWAFSNFYLLKVDAAVPFVRLGPSTRVIGVRPASDIVAQFARPSGYASNAAVAALAFNPDGTMFLKTDTVGAKDQYVPTADSETSTAALVHAVNVKVMAQNLEGAAHTMKATVESGGSEQSTTKVLPAAIGMVNHISTTNPATGQAWTPSDAATSNFGMSLET